MRGQRNSFTVVRNNASGQNENCWRQHGELDSCLESRVKRVAKSAYLGSYKYPLDLWNRSRFKHRMKTDSLLSKDWSNIVTRLGGAALLDVTPRATKAFVRPREIRTAMDLLRPILGYCLGERGSRATAGWAAAMELADVSNPAILYRLR